MSCIMLMFLSESFFMTLDTAIWKSSWVTCWRRSRRANIPASVHTALLSAPLAPFICTATFLRSIPRIKFILREWIFGYPHGPLHRDLETQPCGRYGLDEEE